MGPRQDDADPVTLLLHFQNDGLDPLVDVVSFPRNLLAARQKRFRLADAYRCRSAIEPLYGPGDEVALECLVLIEDRVAFLLAEVLDDHLLGRLGGDAAQFFWRKRSFTLL